MRTDLTQLAYVQNSHRALAHQSLSGSQGSQDHPNHCHNISMTVEDRHGYNGKRIGTRMRFIESCHFK